MNSKELILLTEFEKFINASASGKRLTASGKRITNGVIQNYQFTQKLLEEYEQHYSVTLRIVLLNKASLTILQKEKKYWMKFYIQFSSFLYKQKKYFDNYVSGTFKNIKTFFNYLITEKAYPIGQFHKLFRVPQKQFSPIVLTPEQLNYLITDNDFYNRLNPTLKKIRDILIVGCTLGLRISDLMRLKSTHIIKAGTVSYISIHTKKTGTAIKIPIPDYVTTVFDKYKKKNNNFLLPQYAKANINKYLKQLAEEAGWTFTIPKNMCRQGKIIEVLNKQGKCYRFCDHITAHTMRRTAITTLLILGVPELVVRNLSGHAPGSKEFYKYIAIANEYSNTQIMQAQNKLINFSRTEHQNEGIRLL